MEFFLRSVIFPYNSPFHGQFSSFALQYNPTWMRGNFGLKLQNGPKLSRIYARFNCIIQMSRVNREKGYSQYTQSVVYITYFELGEPVVAQIKILPDYAERPSHKKLTYLLPLKRKVFTQFSRLKRQLLIPSFYR